MTEGLYPPEPPCTGRDCRDPAHSIEREEPEVRLLHARIERLEAERERLRGLLKQAADQWLFLGHESTCWKIWGGACSCPVDALTNQIKAELEGGR
jgi:hypothetical protein